MNIKVDFTLRAVIRKGSAPRYDLNVILKDINADQKVFGKNFSNIELTPARVLDMGDYQLICNERGLGDLMQNSKGLRINGADAETGDKYYFVKVKLSESVSRTCYLSQSQIKNLKYVNLGFEFKETDEVVNLDDKQLVPVKKVKPIGEG